MKVNEAVANAFDGRHGRVYKAKIKYRQMTRSQLSVILAQLRDDERKRAAGIAKSHEYDDPRPSPVLVYLIHDEILGAT